MRLQEFLKHLKTLNLPCQYHHFEVNQALDLPYIIYYNDKKNVFSGDNENYLKELRVIVELYTDYKDVELEERIEQLFNTLKLTFDYQEDYLPSEQMYMITYDITI